MSREMINIRRYEYVVLMFKNKYKSNVALFEVSFIIDECEKFTTIDINNNVTIYDRTNFDFIIKRIFD